MFYVHICLCMLIVIVMFVLLPAWRINFFIRRIYEVTCFVCFSLVTNLTSDGRTDGLTDGKTLQNSQINSSKTF